VLALPAAARAQTASHPLESPTAPVAVLTVALYNAQANLQEATDSAKSGLATTALRARLQADLGSQLRPTDRTESLEDSPDALALAGGTPCNVRVACARWVGGRVGARWVIMAKVSKTSNLIWLLSAQLIDVPTGTVVLDDSTELKGDPEVMIPIGVRIFADRAARTVRAGGVTDNFPQGLPPGSAAPDQSK
jgi:Protein of unknown function (DUF2380)